jgi:tetratricopeptide (TPR) repeat protein
MNAAWVSLSILLLFGLTACDRMGGSRHAQLIQDGDAKSAQGDFARAINLYEAALDDSESIRNAEVHYKLALLYDDKLNDPVSALHHFRRCLALSPTGAHATDVRNSIKRDEIAALTALSGDSVITRSEAARLRNENLDLHKQLEARAVPARSVTDRLQEDKTSSKKPSPRQEAEATWCNQATRSSPFREAFINRPSDGKRYWTPTGRVFEIPKNSRWARP